MQRGVETLPDSFRSFAVIPAAGRGVRMGGHKLLLPWGGSTVIEHVLSAWCSSSIGHVAVVIRPGDSELLARCRGLAVDVVVPDADPAEMKDSVRLGLQWTRRRYGPRPVDAWLLAPADMPRLSAALIDRVLTAYDLRQPSICIPVDPAGRRGHPVLFPWTLASEVDALGRGESLQQIVRRHPVRTVATAEAEPFQDVDTPEDYQRLQGSP